ncbi:AraC family transcriptional regulator [Galbibacter marinus]|uniref:AraC family transcriptional regulator n=1 Tax=Galbibacter marinus TaxID=555500 RepID=K2PYB3_9FLAO|nr:AraC family transcriptional regulator [Galbibacter marinus]EKF56429.1 AraC family transcriptional regulator [Galbibacter marinus]
MKTLTLKDDDLNGIFGYLQKHISGELTTEQGEFQLKTLSTKFKGTIKGKCYSNAISFIKCSLNTLEEFEFKIKSEHCPSFLYFIFCNRGTLMHRDINDGEFNTIDQHQTAVVKPSKKGFEFLIPKKSRTELIILKIHPRLYLKKEKFNYSLNQKLLNIYQEFDARDGYTHYGNYNLKICDYFNEIDNIHERGSIKDIMLEGRIKLLLAVLIKQYKDDIKNRQKIKGLTSQELKRITAVAEHIKGNPSASYSIKKLTKTFAISPSKLQKGFKILYNRTVADYIKNIRVEVAENMIKNRNCTISEIVYDIGFSSRSYFSKIFKEKYNCSPKHYQEKLKLTNLAL